VEDGRGEDGLDGMSDRVAKVDEIAQPRLALVNSDDVCLDGDGALDDGEEEFLLLGARLACATGVVLGGGLDRGEDFGRARLQRAELFFVPDSGGLQAEASLA
jgi:hypothetical protein